jgi:hypothetical protein
LGAFRLAAPQWRQAVASVLVWALHSLQITIVIGLFPEVALKMHGAARPLVVWMSPLVADICSPHPEPRTSD